VTARDDAVLLIRPDPGACSRRDAMRLGAGLASLLALGACAGRNRSRASLPEPLWPREPVLPERETLDREFLSRSRRETSAPVRQAPSAPGTLRVRPRSSWASAGVVPARMDRQSSIRRITVHHDGMPPVSIGGESDARARIDLIRRVHQEQRGWGDIGYHYVIDPLGGAWEGRPLSWQGAHVANQNPGNIGVLCMGNFEVQRPTSRQLASLELLVPALARQHRVPLREIRTHRELAATACPGRNMQPLMDRARARGGSFARALA